MEALREKLNKSISLYGIKDIRTINISKQLDFLIVEEQKKYGGN